MSIPCDNEDDGEAAITLRVIRAQRSQIATLTVQRDACLAVCRSLLSWRHSIERDAHHNDIDKIRIDIRDAEAAITLCEPPLPEIPEEG
jgi:hypothetical protein